MRLPEQRAPEQRAPEQRSERRDEERRAPDRGENREYKAEKDNDSKESKDSERSETTERSEKKGESNEDKREARSRKPDDNREQAPPDSVAELLRRAFAPAKTQSPATAPAKPRLAQRAPGLPLDVRLPDKEILGINLSAKATDRAKTLGFTVHKTVDLRSFGLGVTKLVPPPDLSANEAQRLLEKELPAESFSANRTYHIYRSATGRELDPADRQSSSASRLERGTHCPSERCFGPQLIRWTPKTAECARGVRIGVIDTGIDRMHPAFADSRVTVNRFVNISDKQAPSWHGTGVLALLAGSRLSGTPGLVPHAQFYVADVFFADSLGRPVSDTVGLLQALDWMRRSNVHIVNLSVAGPSDPALEKAIVKLSGDGIIFVAAAGNDGPTAPPAYPAAYKQVIAVTAVNRSLQAYRHANRGDYIDVAAPGVGIWTALPQERGAFHSGTSFASPYVTAIIASLTSKTLRDKASVMRALTIQDLGPPGPDPIYGRGLVLAPSDCAPIKPWVPTVSAKKEPKVAGN